MKIKKESTHIKGQIALLKAEIRAVEKGYVVSRPSEGNRYDLIIDDKGKLYRLQVKCANKFHSCAKNCLDLGLSCNSSRKHYTSEEIDYLILYVPKLDVILCFPAVYFHKKTSLNVNLTNQKSKWYYKNFIW